MKNEKIKHVSEVGGASPLMDTPTGKSCSVFMSRVRAKLCAISQRHLALPPDPCPTLARSDVAPRLLRCCSDVVPSWCQFCSTCVLMLFRCCSDVAPMLFRFCSEFVPILFRWCSNSVPMLFRFGPILFHCGADIVPLVF